MPLETPNFSEAISEWPQAVQWPQLEFNPPWETNYTDQEIDIARQIKEQWGSKEEAVEYIENVRSEKVPKEEKVTKPEFMTQEEINKEDVGEDISFWEKIQEGVTSVAGKVPEVFNAFWEGISNLIWGAISSTPKLLGNTAWAIVDLNTSLLSIFPNSPEKREEAEMLSNSLSQFFKDEWIDNQDSLQEFLNTAPDSKMAKIWEVWAEMAAIMSPTPAWKTGLVLKGKKLLEGIKWGKAASALLSIWAEWAVIWAKAEALWEGELTREWLEEWALANLAFAWAWAVVKKVIPQKTIDVITEKSKELMAKLVKIPTGKTTATAIAWEIDSWMDAIKILKQRNPSFKIEDTKTALKETLEEVGNTKQSIFNQYDEILTKNNVAVKWTELSDEVLKIADNKEFQTLVRNTAKNKGEESLAFEILERKLKNANADRSVLELYDDTKHLQTKLKGLFNQTSSKDALESIVDLQVLKGYNNIIGKKIWGLKGEEFSALKKDYWTLKSFEDSIGKKYKSFITKSDSWLHNYADAFLDSELVMSALKLDVVWFGKAALTKKLRTEFTKGWNPNEILTKVFKWFDDIAEIEANPLSSQLKEKFKEFWLNAIKAWAVRESINNEE